MTSENHQHEHSETQAGNRATNQHGDQPNPEVFPITESAEAHPPQPPHSREAPRHTHRDWHDYSMLIVEGVGVVFLIGYTTFAALQWCEMRKAVKAAERANTAAHDALTRSNRPWLGVDSAKFLNPPTSFKTAGDVGWIGFNVEMVVKNYGTSPALAVGIFDYPYSAKMGMSAKEGNQAFQANSDNMCSHADGRNRFVAPETQRGMAVFPGQLTTYTTNGAGAVERPVENGSYFQWIGCISYRDQFSEKTHHTRFCFIGKIGVAGPMNDCGINSEAD